MLVCHLEIHFQFQEELTKFFGTLKEDLTILSIDIRKMMKNKEDIANSKPPKLGLKTMEDRTTLYANEKEIKDAKDNPELDFIERSLNKALDK